MSGTFKLMKAGDFDAEKQQYPAFLSPKIDGFRCAVLGLESRGGKPEALAYSLKPFPNPFVQYLFARPELLNFDGELTVGPANHPNVIQRTAEVMRKSGKPDVYFHVFDYVDPTKDAATRQVFLQQRLDVLHEMYPDADWLQRIRYVNQTVIQNAEELEDYEHRALKSGFEGVVARAPGNVYKYGRSTTREQTLIKIKRFEDGEAFVSGFSPAMHNTNAAVRNALGNIERSSAKDGLVAMDMVGKIHVYDFKGEDGARRDFDIGPGAMNHDFRRAIWNSYQAQPHLYVDKLVTYKFFKHGEKDVPRHGGFKCFRDPLTMSSD